MKGNALITLTGVVLILLGILTPGFLLPFSISGGWIIISADKIHFTNGGDKVVVSVLSGDSTQYVATGGTIRAKIPAGTEVEGKQLENEVRINLTNYETYARYTFQQSNLDYVTCPEIVLCEVHNVGILPPSSNDIATWRSDCLYMTRNWENEGGIERYVVIARSQDGTKWETYAVIFKRCMEVARNIPLDKVETSISVQVTGTDHSAVASISNVSSGGQSSDIVAQLKASNGDVIGQVRLLASFENLLSGAIVRDISSTGYYGLRKASGTWGFVPKSWVDSIGTGWHSLRTLTEELRTTLNVYCTGELMTNPVCSYENIRAEYINPINEITSAIQPKQRIEYAGHIYTWTTSGNKPIVKAYTSVPISLLQITLDADELEWEVPMPKPKILSIQAQGTEGTGTALVKVKNEGDDGQICVTATCGSKFSVDSACELIGRDQTDTIPLIYHYLGSEPQNTTHITENCTFKAYSPEYPDQKDIKSATLSMDWIQECTPNEKFCSGNVVMKCNEAGTGSVVYQTCGAHEYCYEGECKKDNLPPYCGDGICNGNENYATCPQDCAQPRPVCGNGICETGENAETCPQDCGPQGTTGFKFSRILLIGTGLGLVIWGIYKR